MVFAMNEALRATCNHNLGFTIYEEDADVEHT